MSKELTVIKGRKIIDQKIMKTTGLLRVTYEYTLEDSRKIAALIAYMQVHNILQDVKFTASEIEGENNGYETIHVPFDEDEHRI